jgi:plastocyanin
MRDPRFDGTARLSDSRRKQTTTDKETNMRVFVTAAVVAIFGLGFSACGGSYSTGSGGTPTGPTASNSEGVVTINVVAINGAQSFSPNPATLPAGQLIVWHNIDTTTHRVVLNDRSVDTGDLAPGGSSQAMAIGSGGGQYHCSIHPVMVGSINRVMTTPVSQPCEGPYCN